MTEPAVPYVVNPDDDPCFECGPTHCAVSDDRPCRQVYLYRQEPDEVYTVPNFPTITRSGYTYPLIDYKIARAPDDPDGTRYFWVRTTSTHGHTRTARVPQAVLYPSTTTAATTDQEETP